MADFIESIATWFNRSSSNEGGHFTKNDWADDLVDKNIIEPKLISEGFDQSAAEIIADSPNVLDALISLRDQADNGNRDVSQEQIDAFTNYINNNTDKISEYEGRLAQDPNAINNIIEEITNDIMSQELSNAGFENPAIEALLQADTLRQFLIDNRPDEGQEPSESTQAFLDKLNQNPALITAIETELNNNPEVAQQILTEFQNPSENSNAASLINAINSPEDVAKVFDIVEAHNAIKEIEGGAAFLGHLERAYPADQINNLDETLNNLTAVTNLLNDPEQAPEILQQANDLFEGLNGEQIRGVVNNIQTSLASFEGQPTQEQIQEIVTASVVDVLQPELNDAAVAAISASENDKFREIFSTGSDAEASPITAAFINKINEKPELVAAIEAQLEQNPEMENVIRGLINDGTGASASFVPGMISSIETAADVETAFNIAQSYSEIQAAGGQPVLNALSNFSPQGGAGTLEQTEQLLQAVSEKVQEAQANGVNIAENANQIAVQIVTQEMFNEGAQQALAQSPHVQEFIGNVISTVGPDSNLENTGALGGFIDKLNENPELITALNQNIANSPVTTQHILQQITGTSTSEDPQAAAAGGSEVFGTLIDAVNTPQDMEHLFGVAYMHYEIGQLNGGEAFLSNLQRPELQQAFSGENGISLSALDEGLRTLHGTIVQEGGDRNLLVKINNAMEGMSGQEIAEFAQQFAQNPQQTLQQMNMMLGIQEEINGFMQMFTMLGVTEEQMGGIIGMFQAGNWMEGLTQLFSAVVDGIQNMFSQGMDLLSQGTGGALSQMGATTEHRNPDGTPAAPSNETEDPSADREVAAAAVAPGSSPTG